MAVNQESLNKKLYDLLKTKGYSPIPKNTKNQRTENPQEADVFNFTYRKQGEDVGDAWVSIDDAQDVILYYESDLFDKGGRTRDNEFDDSWTGFVQQLKRWAMTKQLGFELRAKNKLGDDMAQREFTMKKETISEGYYPMTKQSSYSDNVPTVKIVLQHTRQIQEGEQRYRNIARIFLENQQGERILAPTIRPGIAQVYARHLAEGGLPNDDRWNHIKGLCEEYNKMAGFVRATRNGQFNESAMALVTEGANHYQNLRETLSKMRGSRGYHKYFESYTPTLMETENDTSNLNELFVQEKLDPRIESVLPILSKLHKKLDEMKEVVELDEWAKSLSEVEDETTKTLAEPADKMLDEAPGAETLAHNQSTEKSNLKAFDLAEDTGANEKYAEEIIDRIGYEGVLGNIDGNKIYRAVKEYQKMMDNPEDLDVDEVVEIIVDKLDIRHLGEDLGPEQKRVGQLGPTEKVKNNNIGKLVGASESAEHSTMNEDSVEARELELFATNDSDLYRQSYLPIVKNLERKFKKGIYDKELAKKLWVLHAARAAKKYGQEHGNDDGLKIFSTAVRREVAEKLRDDHFAEMEAGNFHDVPFSGSVPAKGTIVDKSGAKHSPMSRAKDLAQRGRDSVKEESITEMDNRTPQGDRREQRANSPEEIAKREKEFQDNLKKAGPEVRKKLGLPEPKDQGVAEGTKIVKELFEPQTDYYKLSNGEMVQVSYKPAANQEPLPGSLQISYVDPKVKPMGAASTAPKSWDQAPETIKQEISKWASSPEAKKQVDEAIEELNRILKLSGK